LSRTRFEEEYLPRALSPEIPAANERTFEQRLAACKMVAAADEPIPTVLGILVLAKSPREHVPAAYVQFLRIGGVEWADPIIDEAVFDGPLAAMIRRLDEKLESHNRVQVNLSAGETEKRSYSYPPEALQQLTRNAVLHRAYEQTNAPVRVYWFADRIEIHSPGGPYGIVTAETLGRPGVADYRNPNLAEAMRVLGYVQRFGVGIQIAQKKLQDNGNPPAEFQVDSSRVLVVVRCAPLDRR
jgi:ATP-dependent DNA helicase RecG